jgi:hypothetical protein
MWWADIYLPQTIDKKVSYASRRAPFLTEKRKKQYKTDQLTKSTKKRKNYFIMTNGSQGGSPFCIFYFEISYPISSNGISDDSCFIIVLVLAQGDFQCNHRRYIFDGLRINK